MSHSWRMPEEIWLEILKHLPRQQLRAVSSANRALRRIALPLLFTHFTLTRPHPLVQPRRPVVQLAIAIGSESAFVTLCHKLKHIMHLTLYKIIIDPAALRQLQTLPILSNLTVVDSVLDERPPTDSLLPALSTLTIRTRYSPPSHIPNAGLYPLWFHAVNAGNIEAVRIEGHIVKPETWFLLSTNFTNLRTLTMDFSSNVDGVDALVPLSLPHLIEFSGPARIAHVLLCYSPLQTLTLAYPSWQRIDDTFSGLRYAGEVRSLTLIADHHPRSCIAVVSAFPNAVQLTLILECEALNTKSVNTLNASMLQTCFPFIPPPSSSPLMSDSLLSWWNAGNVEIPLVVQYPLFLARARKHTPGLVDLYLEVYTPCQILAVRTSPPLPPRVGTNPDSIYLIRPAGMAQRSDC
ncbi:hypothetical protein C8F01DRAFT_1267553 [Mycena amicta]|nr:hypothetical protein C8F01DRAFT_1267553 [Mycena amicta]